MEMVYITTEPLDKVRAMEARRCSYGGGSGSGSREIVDC